MYGVLYSCNHRPEKLGLDQAKTWAVIRFDEVHWTTLKKKAKSNIKRKSKLHCELILQYTLSSVPIQELSSSKFMRYRQK